MLNTTLEGRVLRLTLDRAAKRNALNSELCQQIIAAVESAAADASVGAILLEAAGPVFCAGMDLDEALSPEAPERTALHEKLFTMGEWAVKPLVAAIQGAALGGGLGLVTAAHIAVAAEDARFGLTELRIGMWPFVLWKPMVNTIGRRRTIELALTARLFSAHDALEWGLVHFLAPGGEVALRAFDLARAISNASPETVERGLRVIRYPDWAAELRTEQFASPDFHEGVRAFREKREPRWPSLPERS